MTTMIEDQILKALQKAAIAAVAASPAAGLPIKMVGRVFTPPDDDKYLEIIYIPNNIQGEFWGDGKTYRGMLRVILHWSVDDTGAYGPMQTIGAITDYFKKGTVFAVGVAGKTVKVQDHPDFMGIMEGAPDTMYPVTVRYICVDIT